MNNNEHIKNLSGVSDKFLIECYFRGRKKNKPHCDSIRYTKNNSAMWYMLTIS